MIYLDYAATTPVRKEVLDTISEALTNNFGNPSSGYKLGKSAKSSIREARQSISRLLGVDESSLYFTSGATEANNWAIMSQAHRARDLGYGNHLVVSSIEHSAVIKYIEQLAKEGFTYSIVKPDPDGHFTVESFVDASTQDTIGWIAMSVNNELGTIIPIEALGSKAKEQGYWFHTDSVQAMGKLDWDYGSLPITSFVASAHKFQGPKGIGFLVYQPFKEEMYLLPLLHGGGQEASMRSGTENVPYILGMTKALELAYEEMNDTHAQYQELAQYLETQLIDNEIPHKINGYGLDKVKHIHNVWFQGFKASQILIFTDLADIFISAGSACSAGSITPSRVLQSYFPEEENRWSESIRVSFGPKTTREDINALIQVITTELQRRDA